MLNVRKCVLNIRAHILCSIFLSPFTVYVDRVQQLLQKMRSQIYYLQYVINTQIIQKEKKK